MLNKLETINFKAFMKKEQSQNAHTSPKIRPLYSFIPINPLVFFDPIFLSAAAGILVLALIERSLALHEHIVIAETIYHFLKIAFPIIGFVALYFLLGQLRF